MANKIPEVIYEDFTVMQSCSWEELAKFIKQMSPEQRKQKVMFVEQAEVNQNPYIAPLSLMLSSGDFEDGEDKIVGGQFFFS